MKRQNLHNAEYAKKDIQELFSKDLLAGSLVKEINYLSSCIAYNGGNGNFNIQKLVADIQFSSVKAVLPIDINEDGKTDLVLGGNEFGFQPQLGRLDASEGSVLVNNGKGNFRILDKALSGIALDGQIRDIVLVRKRTTQNLLFLRNNEYPVLYQPNQTK